MEINKLLNEIASGNLSYTELSNRDKVRVSNIMESKPHKGLKPLPFDKSDRKIPSEVKQKLNEDEILRWFKENTTLITNKEGERKINVFDNIVEIKGDIYFRKTPNFTVSIDGKITFEKINDITNLNFLSMFDCDKIKDLTLTYLPNLLTIKNLSDILPNLKLLELSKLKSLSKLDLSDIKYLKHLTIQELPIEDLFNLPQEVKHLILTSCDNLKTFNGIFNTKIETLNLINCNNIRNLKYYPKNLGIPSINLKSLKGAVIDGSVKGEFDGSLYLLRERFSHLDWTDVKFENVTKQMIDSQAYYFGNLKYYLYYLINDYTEDDMKELIDWVKNGDMKYSDDKGIILRKTIGKTLGI
jgi:hypothetical protein